MGNNIVIKLFLIFLMGEELPGAFTQAELRKLYKRFTKLDVNILKIFIILFFQTDGSGELEPEEFFDVPELS